MERVVADEIARPLHAAGIDVDEERRVGGHDDDVAVALEAGHPGGVAEGCAEVGGGRAFARGPLADEDFRPAAIVVVVAVGVDEELLRGAVEVGVEGVVVVVEDVGANEVTGAAATSCRSGCLCLMAL